VEIRIERGTPTAEELAALVGALLLRRPAVPTPEPAPASRWAASARPTAPGRLRRPGRGAWRASALPEF
jgi:hypothetical protein